MIDSKPIYFKISVLLYSSILAVSDSFSSQVHSVHNIHIVSNLLLREVKHIHAAREDEGRRVVAAFAATGDPIFSFLLLRAANL